jgi:hypothetical protein
VADGAGVIQYKGKRGVVWRVKYRDAEGRQVMETIGAERDGVTRKQAEAELRERLVRVERKGYRRPKPLTFGEWSQTWYEEGERRRGWKPGTARAHKYRLVHLCQPVQGGCRLRLRPSGDGCPTRRRPLPRAPAESAGEGRYPRPRAREAIPRRQTRRAKPTWRLRPRPRSLC